MGDEDPGASKVLDVRPAPEERPSRQEAQKRRRHDRGDCFREGCKGTVKTPGAWRCEKHAAEHAAKERQRKEERMRAQAALPKRGPCACGATTRAHSECPYYKSGDHFFPLVKT